jgi:hypothetical protein
MEMRSQPHAPVALPWGKSPQYPLDRNLSGPQSQSGRRGEEKILDPTETPTRPALSQSLYRLSYPGRRDEPNRINPVWVVNVSHFDELLHLSILRADCAANLHGVPSLEIVPFRL